MTPGYNACAMSSPDPSPDTSVGERLAFETLIADTSGRLMQASSTEARAHIEAALERVRTFFHADRAGLMAVGADGTSLSVAVGAFSPGIPQAPPHGVNIRERFPWMFRQVFEERCPVVIPRVEDLPPEAAADQAMFRALGTRTQMTVPIVSGSEVTHLMILSAVEEERDWAPSLVPRVRLLGELFASALQRADAFDALSARERELREHATRIAAAVDTAGVAFVDAAIDGTDVIADASLVELLGLQPGDLENMPEAWLSRIDPAHLDLVYTRQRELRRGDVSRATAEYRYDHPARGWIWLRHTVRRIEHVAGDPRLIDALQDITERCAREESLRQANEELKRLRDRLEHENLYFRKEIARVEKIDKNDLVTGRSRAIRTALSMAEQVASTTSTVLLVGETGTGKERFAEYIHRLSDRGRQHMVRVNCSAIPSALIESELFGREKGAYTGALSKQVGRFELAHGSTLLLDEIGDLPGDVQVKLLRVLQERTIERLGSATPIHIDVRIIASTNRDLEAAVRAGTFRADLYYRINVFPITVPPLRERRDDIPQLVNVLVGDIGNAIRKRFERVDAESLEALMRYDWPGNVRELRNVLERAMILATGDTLTVAPPHQEAAPVDVSSTHAASGVLSDLREVEREHILRVLATTGWRIRGRNAAAEILGLKPSTLEARMERLAIRRPGVSREV